MTTVDIGEVHVWTARAPAEIANRHSLERVLSETEKTAASRFYFERHRLSYIFSHAALRNILSGYIDRRPEELQFGQNSFGKPHLIGAGAADTLNFNMSHSGDVVLVGVTRERLIGIDVEMVRPMKDFASIARLNFTPEECAFIENATGAQQYAFFKSWARKEAVIKAVGKGLSMPLNTFDASIPPDEEGRRLTLPADAPEIESWWLTDLGVPEGYVGAVVVEQSLAALVYKTWQPSLL
jgi:4'-phosphopantetheinyl transferase